MPVGAIRTHGVIEQPVHLSVQGQKRMLFTVAVGRCRLVLAVPAPGNKISYAHYSLSFDFDGEAPDNHSDAPPGFSVKCLLGNLSICLDLARFV